MNNSVEVYMFEMNRIRETDPNGFMLMICGVSLMAFLALTIFGGFIYYLYRPVGGGTKAADKQRPETAPLADKEVK